MQEVTVLVERLAAAWNDRDIETFLSFLTDDVVWDDPAMEAPAVGRDAIRGFSETVLRAFPDFQYRIRPPICVAADGTRCAVPWTITATNLGDMDPPGFAPTGRRVEFDGIDLLEIRERRVSRIDTVFNIVPPAEQLLSLSMRPAPGSLRQRLLVRAQRLVAAWLRNRKAG
jgi:steroid delta-isomerase-like uncharacterized protein